MIQFGIYSSTSSGIITGLKRFIKDDTELIGCLMMHLRAFYSELLESSNQALVKQFSVEKTVQGALDEVNTACLTTPIKQFILNAFIVHG